MSVNRIRPWHIHQAKRALHSGGIIAYPTEAVFGLGCLPQFEQTISKILQLKQRPTDKGLIIVAFNLKQLLPYIHLSEEVKLNDIKASWPGPVTWLFPVKPGVSELITGSSDLIAVRVSAHPVVRALCQHVGPLISTSANPSQKAPAKTIDEVKAYFPEKLDYIYPAEVGSLLKPTEIRHSLTGEIIRSGT